MKPTRRITAILIGALATALVCAACAPTAGHGALRVHPDNPRWLTDDGGQTALVLSGAHTWSVFQDHLTDGPFDAVEYLEGLGAAGHNFTRGWFWEDGFYSPLPYEWDRGVYRLSPPYSPDYSKRLRSRVRAARQRGLFVSVMLFQGWSMGDYGGLRRPNPWPENPYNRDNTNERVTKQEAALHIGVAQQQQLDYVSFIAGKLCSEDNIIWEIANEAHPESFGNSRASNWQENILEHLEGECARRLSWVSCPVAVNSAAADQQASIDRMYEMGSDLISPCDPDERYSTNPPAADGRKVVIADSDHYRQDQIGAEWVWKAFLRGQHPIFMDLSQGLSWWSGPRWEADDSRWEETRGALGAIQEVVSIVNRTRAASPSTGLAQLVPQRSAGGQPNARTRPASSPWALYASSQPCKRRREEAKCGKARANGEEFLALAAPAGTVRFCQLAAKAEYRFRWKRVVRPGFVAPAQTGTADSAGCLELANPEDGIGVVHLERLFSSS